MTLTRQSPRQLALLIATAVTGLFLSLTVTPVYSQVSLIGRLDVPGTATDTSNMTDTLEDGTPHNRLSFGSGIDYTGQGNRYVAIADRGPADGAATYACRVFVFDLFINPGESEPVKMQMVSTILLGDAMSRQLLGGAQYFQDADPRKNLRFDPEGIRVGLQGQFYISEEYGPLVAEFDATGQLVRHLPVPEMFWVKNPAPDKKVEMAQNTSGRQTNDGLEGLALTPDQSTLYALLQAPLIQDGGKESRFCRLLKIDVKSGTTTQYVLPQDRAGLSFNEILAINDHEFLVIERDGGAGSKAKFKRIVHVDVSNASDVGNVPALPVAALPANITPVAKKPFIDLLDPQWNLAGDTFPAKVEGLTFGPDLPDGRRTLIVTIDNDFKASAPSTIFVFALDRQILPMSDR